MPEEEQNKQQKPIKRETLWESSVGAPPPEPVTISPFTTKPAQQTKATDSSSES